jgi:hypothetical protein
MLFLVRNSLVKRKYVKVRCDATASSFVAKVRGEVLARFHTVAVKVTVVCGIGRLACQDEFFVNNPFHVKEHDERALDFALQLSRLFSLPALNRACHSNIRVRLMLSSPNACLFTARV